MQTTLQMLMTNGVWAPEEDEGAAPAADLPEVEGTGGETAGGEPAEPSDSGSDFDWDSLLEEEGGGSEGEEPAAAEPEPQEAEPQPQEQEEPAPEPTPEEEPAPAAAEQEEQEAPAAEPQEEPQPAPSAEEIEQQLTSQYGLSQEDVQAIQSNPEENLPKILPKLAARVHMQVQQQMAQGLQQHLPQFIEQHQRYVQQRQEAVNTFWNRWPGLKGQDEATIARLMQAYRSSNPKASRDELIEDVGAMAAVKLKIPVEKAKGREQKGQSGQSTPAAPAAQTPPPPPAPGGSARPVSESQPAQPANTFESLAEDILREDSI